MIEIPPASESWTIDLAAPPLRRSLAHLIVVDSNIWIFAENDAAKEYTVAAKTLRQYIGSTNLGVNAFIASEVYHILSRLIGRFDAARRTTNLLEHASVSWLPIDSEMMEDAIALALKSDLRINDAVIAQQALTLNAAVLTDDVKDFRKVRGLKVISLR